MEWKNVAWQRNQYYLAHTFLTISKSDKWELLMDRGSAGQALWAKLEIIVIDIEF